MASERQTSFVLDLAVQAGLLSILDVSKCYDTVAEWDNQTVTIVIDVLRPRIWRSRRPASRKQIAYGESLLAMLGTMTDAEAEDIDFGLLDSQAATDEISRLEGILDGLKALDADPTMLVNTMTATTADTNEVQVMKFFANVGSMARS